jgi:opacity protein-like surface antigen
MNSDNHQSGVILNMNVASKIISSAIAGFVALGTTSVLAQSQSQGIYITAYAQASRLPSTTFDEVGNANLGAGLKAEFDTGLGLGGDIGYRYGNGLAAEIEWNWRRHEVKTLSNAKGAVSDGDFASNIIFINGVYRFNRSVWGLNPYLGAGLGWVQEIDFDLNTSATEREWSKQGEAGVQFMAGAEFPLTPQWQLTADIRHLRVGKVTLLAEGGMAGRLSHPRYSPVSVQIGLRRLF